MPGPPFSFDARATGPVFGSAPREWPWKLGRSVLTVEDEAEARIPVTLQARARGGPDRGGGFFPSRASVRPDPS